jgi:hypothetical protein
MEGIKFRGRAERCLSWVIRYRSLVAGPDAKSAVARKLT